MIHSQIDARPSNLMFLGVPSLLRLAPNVAMRLRWSSRSVCPDIISAMQSSNISRDPVWSHGSYRALDYQRMLMWGCVTGSINLNVETILDIIIVIVLTLSATWLSISPPKYSIYFFQRSGNRDALRVNIHDAS